MASVGKNFGYNVALTLSTYISSLIVFPYVTRILGVEMLGRVNYASSIITYLILLSSMGITTIGVREIAGCGQDKEKRSDVFSGILLINIILTIFFLFILFILCICFQKFAEYKTLLLIGSSTLISSCFLVEWLYQGVEDFKYVSIRSIIIKTLYVLSVFVLVKHKNDYLIYYGLCALVVIVNAAVNIIHSLKFVSYKFNWNTSKRFFKPILLLGAYQILNAFFSTFSTLFLGYIKSDYEVGIYTTSTKLFSIAIGVYSAFSIVMMPRMSKSISYGETSEIKRLINISEELLLSITLPLLAGTVILAPQIIRIIAGEGYEGAIAPMQITMFNLLIIGFAQIWVMQVLLPQRKDSILLLASGIAATSGIILSYLLVPKYGAIGSSIVIVVSELISNSISLFYSQRKGYYHFPVLLTVKRLLLSTPYLAICYVCRLFISNIFAVVGVAIICCLVYFVILNMFLLKDSFLQSSFKKKVF